LGYNHITSLAREYHKLRRDNYMNDIHEKQWLYAKGLELAILLKGTQRRPDASAITDSTVSKVIEQEYAIMARNIAVTIREKAREL
jgi:hypothetical protein